MPNRRASLLAALHVAALALLAPALARAQVPGAAGAVPVAAAPSRYPAVDEALLAADTTAALVLLRRYGEAGDAEAWYRSGVLASHTLVQPWVRPRRLSESGVPDPGTWTTVEQSLELATRLAPDSVHYWLRRARHHLWFRSGAAHHEGFAHVDGALGAARRLGGAERFAAAAFDAGMLLWRQWQFLDNRPEATLAGWERAALAADDSAELPAVHHYRLALSSSLRAGGHELAQAGILFALAADSAPDVAVYRRRQYAALGAVLAWEELQAAAARRAARPTGDFVDLLALGLARHGLADGRGADSAFAAARRAMPPEERMRLTSVRRILPLHERAAFGILAPDERERVEERAWLLMDPLWRVPGNELRNEFMARVALAELRWGTGAPGTGVDGDAGLVWVGFGRPLIARVVGTDGRGASAGHALVEWRWSRTVQVQFRVDAGADDPVLLPGTRERLERLMSERGANWGGVPGIVGLDTIAAQSALFRAGRDSADLFVAARVPTHRLSRGMAEGGAILLDLFVLTADGRLARRDSVRWRLDDALRREPGVRAWRHRLPRAAYLHRVEAYEPVQARGARGASLPATLDDVAFALDGFGVSQVLVTQAVASRRPGMPGERWTDFNILPNPGSLHRNRGVSLLWEVYGDDRAPLREYTLQVTLQPPGPEQARALGWQARTGIIGRAMRRGRERDRVSVSWTRRHDAGAPVRVEQVDLGAVKVRPGAYVLRVDVTDAATGRVATTSRLVLVQ